MLGWYTTDTEDSKLNHRHKAIQAENLRPRDEEKMRLLRFLWFMMCNSAFCNNLA